ncbi:hypothetical protein [Pseudochrobactrum asaccharolyticum]|uniref:Uncharacterized protein n=1 Tax=Pseudochrobactrum asaccharolyticum TaxID=354351 RepID=A0A366DK71_9HYPH|nr:hypothetical protein [Pseudochrobactrum asaccharolyticum]RBO90473.1 hypothetical protein DFR47_11334 [Pseudochrobactrum asaccharolyticum]
MRFSIQTAAKIIAGIVGLIFQAFLMYLTWTAIKNYGFQNIGIVVDDYKIDIPLYIWIVFAISIIAINYLLFNYITKKIKDEDEVSRWDTSELDLVEQRINRRIDYLINNTPSENLLSPDFFRKIIEEKFDDEIITSVDEALTRRVNKESKTIRTLDQLNGVTQELKIRLEGPAGRAERHAHTARRMAYIMAILGIGIAGYRIYLLTDLTTTLKEIYELTDGSSIWPFIIAHSAPWLGLVLLIEFTALLFVRFSTQASTQQRYFTEAYTELKDRHAALSIIIEYGTPEQIITSARSMIIYGQRRLAETSDAETINASSNLIQSLTGLVNEAAAKVGVK